MRAGAGVIESVLRNNTVSFPLKQEVQSFFLVVRQPHVQSLHYRHSVVLRDHVLHCSPLQTATVYYHILGE
jgi:hypothetical protein